MAKLRISAEIIREFLLCREPIDIRGATFDAQRDVLVLEISGPGVPDCIEVDAVLSLQRAKIRFVDAAARQNIDPLPQVPLQLEKIGNQGRAS